MSNAGVDGDDEIEALYQCRRVREIGKLIGPINDVAFGELCLVVGPNVLLKADEGRLDIKNARQGPEGNRSVVIVRVGPAARPRQSNP